MTSPNLLEFRIATKKAKDVLAKVSKENLLRKKSIDKDPTKANMADCDVPIAVSPSQLGGSFDEHTLRGSLEQSSSSDSVISTLVEEENVDIENVSLFVPGNIYGKKRITYFIDGSLERFPTGHWIKPSEELAEYTKLV